MILQPAQELVVRALQQVFHLPVGDGPHHRVPVVRGGQQRQRPGVGEPLVRRIVVPPTRRDRGQYHALIVFAVLGCKPKRAPHGRIGAVGKHHQRGRDFALPRGVGNPYTGVIRAQLHRLDLGGTHDVGRTPLHSCPQRRPQPAGGDGVAQRVHAVPVVPQAGGAKPAPVRDVDGLDRCGVRLGELRPRPDGLEDSLRALGDGEHAVVVAGLRVGVERHRLDQRDPLGGGRQGARQTGADQAAADDDDVEVVLAHGDGVKPCILEWSRTLHFASWRSIEPK